MFCDITQCTRKALVGITHQCFAGKNFKTYIFLPLVYTVYIYIYIDIILRAGTSGPKPAGATRIPAR
jgi:hypothetical protein